MCLFLLSVLCAGAALDGLLRERAGALIDVGRERLTVTTVDDARRTDFGVVAEARVASGGAAGLRVQLVLAAGMRSPERGSSFTAWFAFSEPGERGERVLRLRALSAPLGPVRVPEDAASLQRIALRGLSNDPPDWARDGAALVPGMIAGDRSLQDDTLSAQMRVSGLSHLTAVSGANVSLLISAILGLTRLIRLPRVLRWPVALAGLGFFVVMVGPDPSVLRAATMGALAGVAVNVGRPRTSLVLLAVAATVLLTLDPWHIQRAAFQLSVLATAGIVLLAGPIAAPLERLKVPRWFAEAIGVCVAATVACTPVLVALHPEQSSLTVVVNLLAAPCAALVGSLGPALLAVAGLGMPWCLPLYWACLVPAQAVAALGGWGSATGPLVSWPQSPFGFLLAAALCWGGPLGLRWAVLRWRRRRERVPELASSWLAPYRLARRRHRRRVVLMVWAWCAAGVLCLGGGWWLPSRWALTPATARDGDLVFCDVGQGDATLLVGAEASGLLVDAGPDGAAVARCLHAAGVTRLCGVLISHLHADHVAGLDEALRRAPLAAGAPVLYGTAGRGRPTAAAESAVGGERLECGRWTVSVLEAPRSTQENDASLVVRAFSPGQGDGAGLDVLLAGDLEEDAARSALRRRPEITARRVPGAGGAPHRVLKVSHHGAANGGAELPRAFAPQLALIGVGEANDYGHPAARTLDTLAAIGTVVRRSDRDGTLLLHAAADGLHVLSVSTHR